MKSVSKKIRYIFIFLILFLNMSGFTWSAGLTDLFGGGQEVTVEDATDSGFGFDQMFDLVGCDNPLSDFGF